MSQKEINVTDIANALQISPTTVSRAISGKGRVSGKTRQKVINYINENGLEPNTRPERTIKKSMNIGVVLPADGDYAELPFFSKMLMSLYDYFSVRGYSIILIRASMGNTDALRDAVHRHKVDGVILTRLLNDGTDVALLKAQNIPFVVTGTCDDPDVYQVDADQRGACRELTSILYRMGMRKTVLMCANLGQTVIKARVNGYLDAVRENDMPIEQKNIIENAADENVLEKALTDILKMQAECIICSDDGICIAMLNYFRKAGVRVPQDIRVATFYNSPILEEHNSSITSIDFDIREWAKIAGTMLMRILEGEDCERIQRVGYKIQLKESTKFE
jgi:DNA-binding LacI/PurR family transcriptional regulator